eukprot:6199702-Pleurochrysis_carterae.AAC.1
MRDSIFRVCIGAHVFSSTSLDENHSPASKRNQFAHLALAYLCPLPFGTTLPRDRVHANQSCIVLAAFSPHVFNLCLATKADIFIKLRGPKPSLAISQRPIYACNMLLHAAALRPAVERAAYQRPCAMSMST